MDSPPVEAPPSAAGAPPGSPWRAEPFRLFFPLAVLLSWAGVVTWILYAGGVVETYSCLSHGLIQTQAFLPALAFGFLLTAIPRRTRSAAPSRLEMGVPLALLPAIAVALLARRWIVAEVGYAVVFLSLLLFAVRRLAGGARRPPAAFVLLPIGALCGVGGAALLVAGATLPAGGVLAKLGALLVEQVVFLCFTIGAGGLVLPLLAGAPPPADLGSSPRERARAFGYGVVGVVITASAALEALGGERSGPLLRGVVVLGALVGGAGIHRLPAKPGLHRRLAWLGAWLVPVGLLLSGAWPDYRVPALHVTLIGGFALLGFGVATHVSFAHLDLTDLAAGRPRAVVVLGACLLLALAARVVADASHTYFAHLASAAVMWLVGTLTWLAALAPKLLLAAGGPPRAGRAGA